MTESCKSFEWGTLGGEGDKIMKPNQTQKPMLFVRYKKEP